MMQDKLMKKNAKRKLSSRCARPLIMSVPHARVTRVCVRAIKIKKNIIINNNTKRKQMYFLIGRELNTRNYPYDFLLFISLISH